MLWKKIKNIFCPRDAWVCRNKKWLWLFFIILASIVFFYFIKISRNYPIKQDLKHEQDFFGVTFSTKFCQEIGLDWQEVYLATLDDLEVKEIRLPIYWDEIETEPGVFDFTKYDYIIKEGEKRGVNFGGDGQFLEGGSAVNYDEAVYVENSRSNSGRKNLFPVSNNPGRVFHLV